MGQIPRRTEKSLCIVTGHPDFSQALHSELTWATSMHHCSIRIFDAHVHLCKVQESGVYVMSKKLVL